MNSSGGSAMLPLVAGLGVGLATGGAGFGAGAALMAGATAASAGSSIMGGIAQHQSEEFRRAQMKQQERRERMNARERSAQIREEMRRALGAQRASMASRGIDPGDAFGTAGAIQRDSINQARTDLIYNQANYASARDTLRTRADQSRIAGRTALYGGFVDAAATAANAYGSYRAIGNVPKTQTPKPKGPRVLTPYSWRG